MSAKNPRFSNVRTFHLTYETFFFFFFFFNSTLTIYIDFSIPTSSFAIILIIACLLFTTVFIYTHTYMYTIVALGGNFWFFFFLFFFFFSPWNPFVRNWNGPAEPEVRRYNLPKRGLRPNSIDTIKPWARTFSSHRARQPFYHQLLRGFSI